MLARLTSGVMWALLLTTAAQAEIRLPAIFSDHMVLQAGAPVPVWGMAAPAMQMTVRFAGQEVRAMADQNGYWNVQLKPLDPSSAASEMTIGEADPHGSVASVLVIHDVLVGEVWVGAGQSNMGFGLNSMEGKEKVLATAGNPQLRLFTVKHMTAAEPIGLRPGEVLGNVYGSWELSDEKTAANFSAVAYLFGEELQRSLDLPVGMISDNWGGTPIQTWMSLTAFASEPIFGKYVDEYHAANALHQKLSAEPQVQANYVAADKQWQSEVGDKLNAKMKVWNAAKTAGSDPGPRPIGSRPEPKNPDPTGVPLGGYRPGSPGISWNAMFQPIAQYAIKGALWYQGEANVSGYREYGGLLRAMIADWRHAWHEPDMEFLVVQLPALGENGGKTRNLAHMREQQATVLSLPHTGLAVTYDVGDPGNVHPASKIAVAHRLTLLARAKAYGESVAPTGPIMQSVQPDGSKLRVTFAGIGGKLVIGQTPWVASDTTQFPSDKLIGFEIAGDDGIYHDAVANFDGNSVILSAESVPAPKFVRYAWDESPRANLYDSSGLPAAPFRNDRRPD